MSSPDDRAADLVAAMTLEEKVRLVTGYLGVPVDCHSRRRQECPFLVNADPESMHDVEVTGRADGPARVQWIAGPDVWAQNDLDHPDVLQPREDAAHVTDGNSRSRFRQRALPSSADDTGTKKKVEVAQ